MRGISYELPMTNDPLPGCAGLRRAFVNSFWIIAAATTTICAEPAWIARGVNGMVASDHALASAAGLEMLRAGGNAIDAAVAVSFVLGVTRPYSTGAGGGGFMVVYFADGRVIAQDFRETAPAEARADDYVKMKAANPNGPSPSEFGFTAAATPGVVSGRCQALAQWGTLPRDRVLAPALNLAAEGFPIDEDHVRHVREALESYERHPTLKGNCGFVYETYLGGGKVPAVGDILKQPGLARLIEAIIVQGPDAFYKGDIARAIDREAGRAGGKLRSTDLLSYSPKPRNALSIRYHDFRLLMMPLPSSGGIAITQALNILDQLKYTDVVKRDPVEAMHFQIEAMKHAFADRSRHLGDSDFESPPVKGLISRDHAKELAHRVRAGADRSSDAYGARRLPDDAGTSHFCVVDAMGNAVSSTETINTTFGSLAAIEEWGLILNNEMDDFTTEPGKPNAFGLVQSIRNSIAPKKRPLSSMVPTIVLKDEKPFLLLGASGGPRIISSVLNVLLGVLDRGLPLQEAIEAERPHHQWLPDELCFDRAPSPEIASGLAARGHKISEKRKTGIVNAIMKTPDGWVGAADPRKGGLPAGY